MKDGVDTRSSPGPGDTVDGRALPGAGAGRVARLNGAGPPAIRSLLFPAGEAQLLDDWNPIWLRGTGSESCRVEDAFVPERFSVAREEPDKRREPGPLYAFTQQSLYAVGMAGDALGLADAMLDAFMDLARGKTPRGLMRPAESPGVQAEVSRSLARLGSARAWLVETVEAVYDGASDIACIDVPTRAHIRLAGVDAIFPGGAFATSTRCPSRSSRARSTSRPPATSSSATRRRYSTRVPIEYLPAPPLGGGRGRRFVLDFPSSLDKEPAMSRCVSFAVPFSCRPAPADPRRLAAVHVPSAWPARRLWARSACPSDRAG